MNLCALFTQIDVKKCMEELNIWTIIIIHHFEIFANESMDSYMGPLYLYP